MRIDVNNDSKVSVSKVNEIDKNVTKSTGADKNEIFDAGVMTMKFSDVNKSSKAFGILEQDISADDIKAKAEVIKNNLSVIESQMESGNVVKVDEEGIDINNTRTDKIVTVVERIQIKLAAYCDDFNITATGIDMEDIKAVTGNAATYKAAALMSDSEKAYLVKNKLEPTIENVYHAIHSGAKDNTGNLLTDDEWNEILPQVKNIIKDAGLDVNEDTLSLSRYMIDNEIPLDKENLQYFDMLNKLETPDDKTVTERIAATVIEGKSPEKTKVTGEKQPFENTVRAIAVLAQADMYNIMALAKEDVRTIDVLADIEADDTGIEPDFGNQTFAKTYRMIQETRLMMTIEAGRVLENNGISVNTTELSELVENLKKYEAAAMTENTDTEVSVVDRVNDILLAMEQLKTSPAAVLGEVKDEERVTPELLSVRTDRSMTAAKEYETLSTEVRTDLGDNINKAIKASTDDILSGMGYENNEENRRAVRILAYNNLEMTEENIDRIKDLDKSVNLLFKSMTGEKTLKMIRDGKNPLTTDIRELCDYFNNIPDEEKIEKGELTPVFFGSALTNFGVKTFLDAYLQFAPAPAKHRTEEGNFVEPKDEEFSGFVFKIQANMNPAHRDRLAFMRIVSGAFEKGMEVWHSGTNKTVALKQPQQFMADEREAVEEAWAGDIIGLFDPGIYQLGDTLSGGPKLHYENIPVFAPEFFSRVRPADSMKRKQFQKGITQLAEEGAIQTFIRTETGREEFMVGVVGVLQFEVLEHRLKTEYQVDIVMESMPFRFVRWVVSTPKPIDQLKLTSTSGRAKDSRDRDVLLFENEWSIRLACENNAGLELAETANRK